MWKMNFSILGKSQESCDWSEKIGKDLEKIERLNLIDHDNHRKLYLL